MKVQKAAKKQPQPAPKDIALLIERFSAVLRADVKNDTQAQRGLVAVLQTVTVWTYPRGDLTNWIPILDGFDEILEHLITTHEVVSLKATPFTKLEKDVTLHILRLFKLLLVSCTSRKTFSSYDRLGSLLYSFDLELVEAALILLVRPTMQYGSTTPITMGGNEAIQDHLRALAVGYENATSSWEQLRELGYDMLRLATDPEPFQWPPEQRRLKITTQRHSSAVKGIINPSQLESPTSALRLGGPETPTAGAAGSSLLTPQRATPSAATPKKAQAVSAPSVVDIGDIEAIIVKTQDGHQVAAMVAEQATLKPEYLFDAIAKIRFMMNMCGIESRKSLVNIRLLALATYVHLQVEESQLATLLIYNPELVPQIAELVPFDRYLSYKIQASALISLEALARNRSTTADVLTALNANVNHGVLFTLIKGIVRRLTQDQVELPFDFVDAVIAMIAMLTQTPAHAGMMITAGILSLLLELLQSSSPTRASFIPRASGLIDSIIFSSSNAFPYFCSIGGLTILNERIKEEITMCIQGPVRADEVFTDDIGQGMDSDFFYKVTPLKALLRSVHRMMQSSGTAEGLRNLIDSELPKSLKRIFENSDKLGPVVFGAAINIMATFVHNEPTSLAVLQELGLPQILYDRVAPGLVPSLDVICAVPNAIGAICLNQTGLDITLARPELIENVVNIMIDSKYDTVMSAQGNPRGIGAQLDELVRHHPALRPTLLQAVFKLLQTVVTQGNDFTVPEGQEGLYNLTPKYVAEPKEGPRPAASSMVTEETNPTLHHFPKIFGLLEGLFHQPALCNDFLDAGGLDKIFSCIELACIPAHFSSSPAGSAVVKVLRVMAQVDGTRVVNELSKHVDKRLEALSAMLAAESSKKQWSGLVDFALAETPEQAQAVDEAQLTYGRLCRMATTLVLFADTLSYISQHQGRLAPVVLNSLSGPDGKRLEILGQLQRDCTRQAVAFKLQSDKTYLAAETAAETPNPPISPSDGAITIDPLSASDLRPSKSVEQAPCLKSLRSVCLRISGAIGSMLQGSMKALGRRQVDRANAQAVEACSSAMAQLLIANIRSALPSANPGTEQMPSYRSFVMGMSSGVLYDDRTTNGSLQLPLYLSFQDHGGVSALVELADAIMDSVQSLNGVPKDGRPKSHNVELVHALGNLQQAFSILKSLVSTKSLAESPHAAALMVREARDSEQKLFPGARLVKARLDILPAAARLWNASWLTNTPQAVMRSAAQTFLLIMRAQREEATPINSKPSVPLFTAPAPVRQPVVADPARIDQLVEMGFTRQQAENALLRTRNNVNVATELLLTTPHLFAVTPPPVPAPALPPVAEPQAEAQDSAGSSSEAATPSESVQVPMDVDKPTPAVMVEHDSCLKSLNTLRDELRTEVSSRAITLVDECEDLVFDVRSAFPPGFEAVTIILERIQDVAFDYVKTSEKFLAGRMRLLAVMCQGTPGDLPLLLEDAILQQIMRLVTALVKLPLDSAPRWLAATLLVADCLLSHAERVSTTTIDAVTQPVRDIPGFAEGRAILVQASIDTLKVYNEYSATDAEQMASQHEVYLATLRLLVGVTRVAEHAKAFAHADGIALMLATFKSANSRLSGCHALVTIIMRHLVEDENVLRSTMQSEIKRWLTPTRNKVSDVSHFLRQIKQVALRNPNVFLDAAAEECALVQPEPAQDVYHVRSKHVVQASAIASGEEPSTTAPLDQMQVDDPFNSASIPTLITDGDLDSVLSFLFGEIHNAVRVEAAVIPPNTNKDDKAVPPPSVEEASVTNAGLDASELDKAKSEKQQQKRTYTCLLMQLLTELVGSYLPCKTSFLATRRRRELGSGSGKSRPVCLATLINDWVCGGRFEDFASTLTLDDGAQTRVAVSSWACSIVVALCADVNGSFDLKETSNELVIARKVVLEFIARAIKDVSVGADDEQRYGRLYALSNLVLRLLTSKPTTTAKVQDDSALHVAKIMLEKNFVALLTTALSEVDLEYPNIKLLIATVIRPLEQLSKISIKMGKSEKKDVQDDMDVDLTSASDSSSEGVDIAEGMEENLEGYRNSSLGMYTMGASDDEDDEDDEEDSEEGFDEEMGLDPDSDETSDEDDDMDDGDDVGGGIMGDDGDELDWTDDEEEEEALADPDTGGVFAFEDGSLMDADGDDEDSQEGQEEELSEGEFDDELGDDASDIAEMDMDMEMDIAEDGGSEGDMEDEDALALEDMERFAEDLGYELDNSDPLAMFEDPGYPGLGPAPAGHWGWTQTSEAGASRPRSNFLDRAFGVMGGADSSSSTPRPRQTAQHPLLTEPSNAPGNVRRPPRGQAGVNELVNNIENLLGHEAAQTLERLITQGRINGADAIRIDVAQDEAGEVRVSIGGRQMVMPAPEASSSMVSSTLLAEFVPKPTLQRWLEELNLVHGPAAPARVEALIQHVVGRLLPEARRIATEDAKRLQEEEERAQASQPVRDLLLSPQLHPPTTTDESQASLPAVVEIEPASSTTPAFAPDLASPEARVRVTVMIHDREVDITDTGIDLDFLEALPDEMRADVIEQHMREQARQQARVPAAAAPEAAPQINSEFLDALPPDIRAEVIQQEALEQARRSQVPPRVQPPSVAPGNFLASLDSDLREVVLMDQADALLSSSDNAAPSALSRQPPQALRQASGSGQVNRKKAPDRESIQLLDRQGVAALVRLLFLPDVQRTHHLLKVMVNLCQNSKTRSDLLDSMLTIVQEGSAEINNGERATMHNTPRGKATPKGTPRRRQGAEAGSTFPLSMAPAASIPTFVAQRCLESLYYIVTANEAALRYFLNEHDLPAGLRKTSRKGKGKEKTAPNTFYPVVALLALFERPTLLHASHILEALTSLLSVITKPLVSLPALHHDDANNDSVDHTPANSGTASVQQLDSTGPDAPVSTSSAKEISAVSPATKRPVIPDATLRPIINVMTTGECSSRSFANTLSAIQHLSQLADARDVFVDELSRRAQSLGQALYDELEALEVVLSQEEVSDDDCNEVLARFSPASSTQAQLLRVLKTLDFMFSDKAGTKDDAEEDRRREVVAIYDSFNFGQLWQRLAMCLEMVQHQAEETHVATVLLPLIEALMVVCKYSGTNADMSRQRAVTSPMSPKTGSEEESPIFLSFTDRHRKILNTLVRNNPALMSGSFSLLVLNSKVLEFDNKRNWFYQKLKRKREVGGVLQLSVRRQYVFEDSFQMLQRRTGDEIKFGKLSIKFHGEDGVDAGGVTREWYSVLAKQIFDPNFALFEPCHADQLTYQPNKSSGVNNEHLAYFKFVGRVIGKAVFDNRLLDAYFSRAFYKQILGKPVDLRDLESIDPDYHKSLLWMLDNDITGVVDNEFTTDAVEFGETKTVELKPGGAQISVTQDNKEEYVRLMVSYLLSNSIQEQITAFLSGFYDIIPQHLVQIFQPDQLELLISGISTIDVDELKNATQLHGWKNSDPEITWFWRALRSFSQEERAHFLMFVTSSSRVPLGGFSQLQGASGIQPFQIHKLHTHGALPSAATCFNLLKLGSYADYETLRAKLLFAMYEGGGFGLA